MFTQKLFNPRPRSRRHTRFPCNVQDVPVESDDFQIGVVINGVEFTKREN
jgi:hypothetical protein